MHLLIVLTLETNSICVPPRDQEALFSEKQTHWICYNSQQKRTTKYDTDWKGSNFVIAECLTIPPRLGAS